MYEALRDSLELVRAYDCWMMANKYDNPSLIDRKCLIYALQDALAKADNLTK